MDESDLADGIARLLSWVWHHHRRPEFLDNLAATYDIQVPELPRFDKVCLMEAEYGDAAHGVIGSAMRRWWLADGRGIRTVHYEEVPPYWKDFNESRDQNQLYYCWPVVKFLREGSIVTFGEAFGPDLHCRKVGRVAESGDGLVIKDVRLVWNIRLGGGLLPSAPVFSGFEISERGPRLINHCVLRSVHQRLSRRRRATAGTAGPTDL